MTPGPSRTLTATRYVVALREGGSVPAVVEADDGQLWVAKLRGSAQGGRVLAAEMIVGELARAAGLRVPALAVIDLDAAIGRSEPHQEIREGLLRSVGSNLAMAYLAGAVGYDAAAQAPVAGDVASRIVALDAFAANVDRTARNPNLLWWQGELWLIDHGASLTWHHGWEGGAAPAAKTGAKTASDAAEAALAALATSAAKPFARIADHVLLRAAERLPEAGAVLAAAFDDATIARAVDAVPDAWLDGAGGGELRAAYVTWLRARRAALPAIVEEAERVRAARV
jgi:hypothetical protein